MKVYPERQNVGKNIKNHWKLLAPLQKIVPRTKKVALEAERFETFCRNSLLLESDSKDYCLNRQNVRYFWIWWKFRYVAGFMKKITLTKSWVFVHSCKKNTKIHVNLLVLVLKVTLWAYKPEKTNFRGCICWNSEVFCKKYSEREVKNESKNWFCAKYKLFLRKSCVIFWPQDNVSKNFTNSTNKSSKVSFFWLIKLTFKTKISKFTCILIFFRSCEKNSATYLNFHLRTRPSPWNIRLSLHHHLETYFYGESSSF
jgi:hypothetical protein